MKDSNRSVYFASSPASSKDHASSVSH